MDPQKMANRVVPMLSRRGLRALAGASPGVQATLLSGVDVGVCLANIEGLAGFAEQHKLTLDGMVELGNVALGRATNPGLGSYSSAADTAQLAKNNALNANSESAAAKKSSTQEAAKTHLVNAQRFINTAMRLINEAGNDYNSTDPASDPTGVDAGIAQGAMKSAQNSIASAQANLDSAAAFASKLPSGGGGGPPPPHTCPAGQHRDANGNCVPDTAPPTPEAKSSTNWWLIGAGVFATGVIAWAVTQPSEEEKAREAAKKRRGALAE